jgi:hypothetical protein
MSPTRTPRCSINRVHVSPCPVAPASKARTVYHRSSYNCKQRNHCTITGTGTERPITAHFKTILCFPDDRHNVHEATSSSTKSQRTFSTVKLLHLRSTNTTLPPNKMPAITHHQQLCNMNKRNADAPGLVLGRKPRPNPSPPPGPDPRPRPDPRPDPES